MVVGGRELIDTLWNVNEVLKFEPKSRILELIDTLWNVNKFHRLSFSLPVLELIDTLWNVNHSISAG